MSSPGALFEAQESCEMCEDLFVRKIKISELGATRGAFILLFASRDVHVLITGLNVHGTSQELTPRVTE